MMRTSAILYFALWFATFEAVAGSYRYGTLSWKHVEAERPNTVEFELITAWTRSFKWVYVRQVDSPDGSVRTLDSPPIVGDVLRVTGLTFADETGTKSTEMGSSSIVVKTGDGAQYFVDVQVTAYSASEDWVMGNFTFRHSYATPYDANAPFIPLYPDGFSYEASTGAQLAANQPFKHTAWVATFEGCCRAAVDSNVNNRGKPYKVHTMLDLTDRNNAPAARTLPVVTVPVAASADPMDQPMFYVMAKDQFTLGRMDPKAMSSQSSNFPGDDDIAAPLRYKLATAMDLHLAPDMYTQAAGVTVHSDSGMVTVTTNGAAPGFRQVAIVVDSGSSRTVIDMMVRVIPAACQPMPVNTSGVAYMGEMKAREMKMGWVGYGLSVPIWVASPCSAPDIVLNYVFASLSVEASSASANGIVYNSEPGGLDSQGMPMGAMLGSMAMDAIVDVRLTLDNPFSAHRPGHDAAVNKANRDYTNAPGAQALWDDGYRPVLMQGKTLADLDERALSATISFAAFNMNSGTGGAAVYMWVKRGSAEPAITEFAISTTEEEEEAAQRAGFMRLDTNVNEQSSSPDDVYVWYKKGSGAAITHVTLVDDALEGPFSGADFMPIAGYPNTAMEKRNLNSGTEMRKLFMYVKKAPQERVQRILHWVPQMAGHYIFCYSGSVLSDSSLASTQRCIDMDIRLDAVPSFVALPAQQTLMGKVLTFWVQFDDINHPDAEVMIGMDATQGQTLAGARFVGEPMHQVIDAARKRTMRMVEWFPDATYGGFDGKACFTAMNSDSDGATPASGCVDIRVERCKWFVQTEDTLIQIAARFASNWLQIWHFNPEILHPDSALPPSNEIWIGHLYEIEPNDVLSVLAERFGTSIRHIQLNNWGLSEQLTVGQHICIIPNSCVTAEHVVRT